MIPFRPRLSRSAMLRRHRVDGEDRVVLHDTRSEEVIELEEAQLAPLASCDGTRDLGGVMLAASRAGAYRRASAIHQLIADLAARGLVEDGIEPAAPRQRRRQELGATPLEVLSVPAPGGGLSGFRLHCSLSGACCQSFSSIAFRRSEVARALALVPEIGDAERLFLPLHGSDGRELLAVTLVDGACAFLDASGGCSIHARGAGQDKPLGCQLFPRSFVHDGSAVRVSVRVECACVLESLEASADAGAPAGEPLLPEGAATLADLPAAAAVPELPPSLLLSGERSAAPSELRAWSQRLLDAMPPAVDGVAACWALSRALAGGLDDPEPMLAAPPPSPGALAAHLSALGKRTRGRALSAEAWRSGRDRARRLAGWLDEAARALTDHGFVASMLAAPARHESFYLRAVIHGHQLVGERSLARALADRAVRLLLARAAAATVPESCRDDASARHPLTAVEMMMRAQGLEGHDEAIAEPR
jgi:lysine-N-methylase